MQIHVKRKSIMKGMPVTFIAKTHPWLDLISFLEIPFN